MKKLAVLFSPRLKMRCKSHGKDREMSVYMCVVSICLWHIPKRARGRLLLMQDSDSVSKKSCLFPCYIHPLSCRKLFCAHTTVSRCNLTKSLVVWDIYLAMRCCDLYSIRSVILSFLCWCLPDEAHLLLRAARYRHLSTIKSWNSQPYRVCPDWRSGTGVLKLYFMNVIKCQSVCLTRSRYMFDVSPLY